MEKETIRIMLCADRQQLWHYFLEPSDRVRKSGRPFGTNKRNEITDGEDRYVFVTPDDARKVRGMRIGGWDEFGSVYQHPHYQEMRNLLETRLV